MKKLIAFLLCALVLTGCATQNTASHTHTDADNNGVCDGCNTSVLVTVDFYNINDLHGKLADDDTQPGVDELTTYLKKAREQDTHMFLLSTGDMWQGSPESNLTSGNLTTEWMNDVGFTAMTLGNHEYDWGEDPIKANAELAQFPFLAINIYEHKDDTLVDYCQPSVMVEAGDVQIGIIGAMGDCYSSISSDKVEDVYFKVGDELTALVMDESEALRKAGADYIVYMIHDGYGQSKSGTVTNVKSSELRSYYDTDLSNGYVDLVFESHTHQRYILKDAYGVYHLQNKGENKGISHVEVSINSVTGKSRIQQSQLVASGNYALYEDDPIVETLLNKYDDVIGFARDNLGTNSSLRRSYELQQKIADLYYELGEKTWGKEYKIVLGGGFISARSPYELPAGDVNYGQLQMIFPFDNPIVLCSISGRDLQKKFFETDNDRYYISYGSYGEKVENNINPTATYYIVTDSYTSLYKYNNLTEIARYDEKTFARDLLADYIAQGGFSD